MNGQTEGTTHLCQGQAAGPVGAIAAMQRGDVQTNTYAVTIAAAAREAVRSG